MRLISPGFLITQHKSTVDLIDRQNELLLETRRSHGAALRDLGFFLLQLSFIIRSLRLFQHYTFRKYIINKNWLLKETANPTKLIPCTYLFDYKSIARIHISRRKVKR